MKIIVYSLFFLCSCSCLPQELDLNLLRLSNRVPLNALGEKQIDQINSLITDSVYLSPQRAYLTTQNDNKNERQQKAQESTITYKIDGSNNDVTGKTPQISKVTVQLHLDEKSQETKNERKDKTDSDSSIGASNSAVRYAIPPESILNEYRQQKELINSFPSDKNVQIGLSGQTHFLSSPSSVENYGGSSAVDQDTKIYTRIAGTTGVQIIPPPSQSSHQQPRIQFITNSQRFPEIFDPQVNSYVSTPSPIVQTISNRNHVLNNYAQSEKINSIQYVSSPSSSVQYLSTPPPSLRFIDQISQHKPSESINSYVSTPAPQIQASIAPNSLYVSTPTNFASTPSPIQYATGSSVFASRVGNYQDQISNKQEKQMHIDHFDNAVSGVRNPKYNQGQSSGNVFVSTTPGPIILSSIIPPTSQEKNDINWRTASINANNNYQLQSQSPIQSQNSYQSPVQPQNSYQSQPTQINTYHSQQSPLNSYQSHTSQINDYQSHSVPINFYSQPTQTNSYQPQYSSLSSFEDQEIQNKNPLFDSNQDNTRVVPQSTYRAANGQNIQRETLFSNDVDAANNLMINALRQNYIGEKQHIIKTTYHRDVDKDMEITPTKSYSNNGWKLSPNKRGSIEISHDIPESQFDNDAGVFKFAPTSSDFLQSQAQSGKTQLTEYRPYPNNPFLNHISFVTASPAPSSESIRTINFQPDKDEQHNVNVGYSIGFGNQPDQGHNPNRFYYNEYTQQFTTASSVPSTLSGDIIKGVQVSQVSAPERNFLQKYSNDKKYSSSQNDIYKLPSNQKITFTPPSNQIIFDNTLKSPSGVKGTETSPSGKIYQYFINTSPTKDPSNNYSPYQSNEEPKNKNFQWSNIGAGVEVSSSPNVEIVKQVVRESPSPNSILYIDREAPKDRRNSYYYPPQKESTLKVLNFDHENALKNIQPIGLSNAISDSNLGPNAPLMTISPTYTSNQFIHDDIKEFSQNIVQTPQNSFNTPSSIDLGGPYRNFKSYDRPNSNEKVFNVQSSKPYESYNAPEPNNLRSLIFKNGNNPKAFESTVNIQNVHPSNDGQTLHFTIKQSPNDLRLHGNNIEQRHKEYTPSESFRHNAKISYVSQETEKNQPIYNRLPSDLQKGPITISLPNEQYTMSSTKYANPIFFNQNLAMHKTDENAAGSESHYQLVSTSNKPYESPKSYEATEKMFDKNKLYTIHGMKVANPYNVNLNVLADIFKGKTVVDDSKFENVDNMRTIELDTSILRDMLRKERLKEFSEELYPQYDFLTSSRRTSISQDITPIYGNEDKEDGYESKSNDDDFEQNDDDEHDITSHHAGSVIDQPIGYLPSQRSGDEITGPEIDDPSQFSDDEEIAESNFEEIATKNKTSTKPVKIHNEKNIPEKNVKPDPEIPYPLLQPPRYSAPSRSHLKSERHPLMPRKPGHPHHHVIMSKSSREGAKEMRHKPIIIVKTETS